MPLEFNSKLKITKHKAKEAKREILRGTDLKDAVRGTDLKVENSECTSGIYRRKSATNAVPNLKQTQSQENLLLPTSNAIYDKDDDVITADVGVTADKHETSGSSIQMPYMHRSKHTYDLKALETKCGNEKSKKHSNDESVILLGYSQLKNEITEGNKSLPLSQIHDSIVSSSSTQELFLHS